MLDLRHAQQAHLFVMCCTVAHSQGGREGIDESQAIPLMVNSSFWLGMGHNNVTLLHCCTTKQIGRDYSGAKTPAAPSRKEKERWRVGVHAIPSSAKFFPISSDSPKTSTLRSL